MRKCVFWGMLMMAFLSLAWMGCSDDDDDVVVDTTVVLNVLGQDTVKLPAAGGSMNLDIEANVGYKYELTDWVTVAPKSCEASKSTITLAIAPNPSLSSRTAKVIVRNAATNAEVKKVVLIQQGAEVSMEATATAAAMGQVLTIPVTTTSGWEAVFDGTADHSWLTFEKEGGNLKVTVEKNNSLAVRMATLKVQVGLGAGNAKNISIAQTGRTQMVTTAEESVSFGFDETIAKSYTVTADEAEWSVARENQSDTWLTVSKTETGFTISCENNSGGERSGDVIVRMDDNSSFVRIKVSQAKYVAPLILSETGWELPYSVVKNKALRCTFIRGDRVVVTSSDEAWLTASVDADISTLINVNMEKNNSGVDRTATLEVKLMSAEEVVSTVIFRVVQAKAPVVVPFITLAANAHKFTWQTAAVYTLAVTSNIEWKYGTDVTNRAISLSREGDNILISYDGSGGPIAGGGTLRLQVYPEGSDYRDPLVQIFEITTTTP